MPLGIYDKIKPKGEFAIADAADIEMPDGSRLSDLNTNYPLEEGTEVLAPDKYYVFGEVSSLAVTLEETNDGKVHEYAFEFTPTEDFAGLTVTPEPKWVAEPQFVFGKTCQVSIMRGIGVLIRA